MKPPKLSRRAMLMTGAAVAGAGVLGAVWFASANPADLVFALIQRALPGVRLDPVSVRACAGDVYETLQWRLQNSQRFSSSVKLRAVRMGSEILGLDRIASAGPFEARLEEITRLAVTRLLTNSNFFDVRDPRAEIIVYRRPEPDSACGNPFADLTPPR